MGRGLALILVVAVVSMAFCTEVQAGQWVNPDDPVASAPAMPAAPQRPVSVPPVQADANPIPYWSPDKPSPNADQPRLSDIQMVAAYLLSLQQNLPAHGFRPGPATGDLDPATVAAIRAYQRKAGLQEDVRSPIALQTTLDSVLFAKPPIVADLRHHARHKAATP